MSTKRESTVATKTYNGVEVTEGYIEIEGERLATETFEVNGEKTTVRELLGYEGDEAYDAALGPENKDGSQKFNQRLNTHMSMAKALVEPKRTVDTIGKMGTRKYLLVLASFNRLNSLPTGGNPTVPAGSAGPTSPDSGEPPLTT